MFSRLFQAFKQSSPLRQLDMTKPKGLSKVYAVRRGRKVGLFYDYEDVKGLVYGFAGAQHKSFPTRALAVEYLMEGGLIISKNGVCQPSNLLLSHGGGGDGGGGGAPSASADISEEMAGGAAAEAAIKPPMPRLLVGEEAERHASLVIEGLKARSYLVPANIQIQEDIIYTLYFDGASRGNPGWAGCGCAVVDFQDNIIAEVWSSLPYGTTNNEAEYGAVLLGLNAAANLGIRHVIAKGDSQLVVKQAMGEFRVKNERLVPYFRELSTCMGRFATCTLESVPRNMNSRADALANKAVDAQLVR